MKICLSCHTVFEGTWACPECHFSPGKQNGFLAFAPDLSVNSSSGFDLAQFAALHTFEETYFWFKGRNSLISWALKKYFSSAQKYLEIGCGTGYVLQEIGENYPDMEISASEISVAGLPFAACRAPRAILFQMDARSLPFKSEFDVIGAYDVLEHIEEDETVLRQMYQAIRSGGGIILTVPQHRFLWSNQDEYSGHFRRYSRGELAEKVRHAGFEVVGITSFVSLLLPLLMMSRFIKNKKQADPAGEFRIGKFMNSLLGVIMQVEQLMILAGVRFPAGGSLLLIGKKTGNKVP